MSQCLKALAVFVEDPRSIHSTQTAAQNCLNSSSRSEVLLWPPRVPHTQVIGIQTDKQGTISHSTVWGEGSTRLLLLSMNVFRHCSCAEKQGSTPRTAAVVC